MKCASLSPSKILLDAVHFHLDETHAVGKLGNISGKEAAKAFAKDGWQTTGQVGSHLVMTKPDYRANLSIPQHKELSVGTLRSLIRSAQMSVDEFLTLL